MINLFKNLFTKGSNQNIENIINNSLLVDVRTPQEFVQGNVPGSINIPLNEVEKQLKKFEKHENIIVFCRSGNRSAQAKYIIEQNGFKNVTNGGTWQQIKSSKNAAKK